ncbi:hypothetical protein BDV27DRAFT_123408 [Aspergillus caelatus]|uniref:Uncharacterized protein n=1 Tax=Aspergillus caelatus TaxID=61420 RepID=A0A5N7AGM8_9EURO|nr:uncharacterized protein BDV27DRAFT_123408 [Aspergillus caelatus]KAE8367780.1 hypothetical protein BDV27DRAFT_123408 [Aspergillus caelatus]
MSGHEVRLPRHEKDRQVEYSALAGHSVIAACIYQLSFFLFLFFCVRHRMEDTSQVTDTNSKKL